MKKLILFLFLFVGLASAQYGQRYLQSYEYVIAPSADSTITFTDAWYNVTVYTTASDLSVKFGDANTTLSSEPLLPMSSGISFTFGEKTPLKKFYVLNNSATDSSKVYFIGDKSKVK